MKKILTTFILVSIGYISIAQSDPKKTSVQTGTKISIADKIAPSKKDQIIKTSSSLELPDLKFTVLNVTAVPSTTSIGTYTLYISYTVKNIGLGAIDATGVTIQASLTNEDDLARSRNLSFTGSYRTAGGGVLSATPEILAPGDSKQQSYEFRDVALATKPKPIFFIIINPFGGAQESNTENNRAETIILL